MANQAAADIIREHLPTFPLRYCGHIYRDTTQFMSIDHGDVIALDHGHYLVMRDEVEGRFGIEDPKYWVKRCRHLESGESKILKLVFHESFPMKIGEFTVTCYRSPIKEARILKLVEGDQRFMQGSTIHDDHGNPVRILDIIRGRRLDFLVEEIEAPHQEYFHNHLPDILEKFIGSCRAIGFLHQNYEKHGDIRRDHLFVEHRTGAYRWIDFDYTFEFHENPFGLDLFGLGNILIYLVGQGVHTPLSIPQMDGGEAALDAIVPGDFSILLANRLVNLKKLFPYVPDQLNRVLMHFSASTEIFYDSVDELLADLAPCPELLRRASA